ncbi:cysteine--tRNA ligase [Campylobacter canadensis]|uniref:Cysteine--tRNA ligase n=1 Tax=Campylobacter canadensis TaxID=449520 RepID=A0ABS7WR54_9BACT|nr:cysteine--tRNA ligase [Campylobacter canadensis]MBZ7987242.1 cysteine--tRNA ligase [Campylobacter canadensis]MBZ7994320.1 cysteine--tRNA ligase [Campylobacter canadensis]MBZ7996016.1 cysteine--tRNA ligase [Campylobacter canadensis]MBZ7998329.1 cysteine--tRNA ligase [Campylobacter canadensis]MBZ7999652.1 cysteine--tRNA ligase [Campylobacter canadensis]
MLLFDSVKKEKIEFNEDTVNIYVCGPTVYDDAHLGHARSSISFDLLRRVLLANNKKVCFAKNYTDIDDKILLKMQNENKSLKEITEFYIKSYEEDMQALNILKPDFSPKATDYIAKMIEFITCLLEKNYAYTLDDGIYLDTSKDSKYLSLSKKAQDDTKTRLDSIVNKKNASDFVLWKFDEKYYKANFGTGRPGWHTECVCMILDIFTKLHIHCGGADLFFPHHENEACQCRLNQNTELADIWLHNGFVNINNTKMSKSLNNSFFVKDALKEINAEVLRFYLQSIYYRADFNYNFIDLKASKKRLDKIYRVKKLLNLDEIKDDFNIKSSLKDELLSALNDDLNISLALACVDEWINKVNSNPKNEEFINDFIALSSILGIAKLNPKAYFQDCSKELKDEIIDLINKRTNAKANKDYKLADEIREKLSKMGVSLQDNKDGVEWELV